MSKKIDTKYICMVALGIALYCVLSLTMNFPLGVGHIRLDLGYLALAIYAYHYGIIPGAIVGGMGATIMSLISGYFSLEWVLANIVVGLGCGALYQRGEDKLTKNWAVTFLMVAIAMLGVKTAVGCLIYKIPFGLKFPKSFVAWIADSLVMCIGAWVAPQLPIKVEEPEKKTEIKKEDSPQ